jgi:hypothetical protein
VPDPSLTVAIFDRLRTQSEVLHLLALLVQKYLLYQYKSTNTDAEVAALISAAVGQYPSAVWQYKRAHVLDLLALLALLVQKYTNTDAEVRQGGKYPTAVGQYKIAHVRDLTTGYDSSTAGVCVCVCVCVSV